MKPLPFLPQRTKLPTLESDLLKLTALIRERESTLVMLLQEKRQKNWQRPQWLLKECEYQQQQNKLSRQIRRIVLNWVLLSNQQNSGEEYFKLIRGFWLKLKIVMKMSLQRVKLLNLLSYTLFQRYEAIIDEINCGYDRAIGIIHYRNIEDMIKNRNRQIHELLNQKQISLMERNKSDYRIKYLKKEEQTEMRSSKLLSLTKRRDFIDSDWRVLKRPFSHQSKRPIGSKQISRPKFIKKFNSTLDDFEHKLYNIMQMKIDASISKKKSLKNNLESLHNELMQRNAKNQKEITNFILGHSGKMIRRINTKKIVKLNHKIKKIEGSPSIPLRKVLKNKQIVRNRGLTLGKLKKKIDKIGKKLVVSPQLCFGKHKKLL